MRVRPEVRYKEPDMAHPRIGAFRRLIPTIVTLLALIFTPPLSAEPVPAPKDLPRYWNWRSLNEDLDNLFFLSDGQRGWAVGEKGTILTTADGGKNWSAQHRVTKVSLKSVQFSSDGQRGWAVVRGGSLSFRINLMTRPTFPGFRPDCCVNWLFRCPGF